MRKKELFAMIRQLGIPTFFISLSAADTRWPGLLKTLGKFVDHVNYTDEQIKDFDWSIRNRLVSGDPVTCARYFYHRFQQFMNLILQGPHSPLQKVTDWFYRVEFQQRGSPHIHMMTWVKGAPRYATSSEEEVVSYIDKIISVSSNVSTEEAEYLEFQKHKHSKSCRKSGVKPVCRFGFPIPPMKETMILQPLEQDDDKNNHVRN